MDELIPEAETDAIRNALIEHRVHELAQDVRELTVRVQSIPVLGQRVGATEDATRRLETAIDKMGDKFTAALVSVSDKFDSAIQEFQVSVLRWVTIFALLMGVLIAVLQLVVVPHP